MAGLSIDDEIARRKAHNADPETRHPRTISEEEFNARQERRHPIYGDPPREPHVLVDATEQTLAERGKVHGDFKTQALTSQMLKDAVRCAPRWLGMPPEQCEAVDMILHKIARVVCGDPNHVDHWHDIGGYARLVENSLTEKSK